MGLEQRVSKLEQQAGIVSWSPAFSYQWWDGDSCPECAEREYVDAVQHEWERSIGFDAEFSIADTLIWMCICGREVKTDVRGYGAPEREALRRINFAHLDFVLLGIDRMQEEDYKRMHAWFFSRLALRGRKLYGAAYDEGCRIVDNASKQFYREKECDEYAN
jgi:hypothetical protein